MNKIENTNISNKIVYDNGELELDVSVEQDTVWLNRNQLSELFDRDVKTIGKHINNVFKEKELEKNSTVANFATVQNEGEREVTRVVEYYNLDIIISVGYRVKSQKGVRFRQWATSVLKQYITNGYAINSDKITHDRFVSLEDKVNQLSTKVNSLESKQLKTDNGIFFNGQIFDSYNFISELLRKATKSIILIDNYMDDTTLTLFSKIPNIQITIYTDKQPKQLKLDLNKYNKQYNNVTIKTFKDSHDRFLILDNKDVYLIGASLKDVGKRWFGFSKLDISSIETILKKLP